MSMRVEWQHGWTTCCRKRRQLGQYKLKLEMGSKVAIRRSRLVAVESYERDARSRPPLDVADVIAIVDWSKSKPNSIDRLRAALPVALAFIGLLRPGELFTKRRNRGVGIRDSDVVISGDTIKLSIRKAKTSEFATVILPTRWRYEEGLIWQP